MIRLRDLVLKMEVEIRVEEVKAHQVLDLAIFNLLFIASDHLDTEEVALRVPNELNLSDWEEVLGAQLSPRWDGDKGNSKEGQKKKRY